jgi:hypothetical protein
MIRSAFFLLSLLAGTTNMPPRQAVPPEAKASPDTLPLHEIAPGILEYNGVRLDRKNHRVSFPATVSFRQGLIEYLLVNEKGKTYESLLKTVVQPHDIHMALLLIGLKEDVKANANEPAPPSAIDAGYLRSAPKLKGAPVRLSVIWTQDGKRKEVPMENWVFNLQTNHPMTRGPWTYNGSLVQDGVFLADQELSIVAVITDPTALVNNPRKGYDNEDIWQVREEVVPPLDTPVEVSITLAEPTSSKP